MDQIFGFIIYPMELGLVALAVAVGSAGIGIILFTVFVRLVLSPLQIVQLRSAKAMQRIQPLLAELKQKHGKDREALSRETMALYREHKVNPAMGCLPTLLQFPILIGLFYALLHLGNSYPKYPDACGGTIVHNNAQWLHSCYAIKSAVSNPLHIYDLFHAQFLWLSNGLGQPDPLYILPVLAGVTQWVQSRMMLTRSTDPQQQMMNSMMNFMPLLIIFFATRYPSGLSLYWVTSTLIGILIQYRITGWGLLPETLGNMFSMFGSKDPKAKARQQRASSSASRAKSQTAPKQKTAPEQKSAPAASGDGLAPDADAKPAEPGVNGKNGSGAAQPKTGATTPRRRANRARGGRGGGRRG